MVFEESRIGNSNCRLLQCNSESPTITGASGTVVPQAGLQEVRDALPNWQASTRMQGTARGPIIFASHDRPFC